MAITFGKGLVHATIFVPTKNFFKIIFSIPNNPKFFIHTKIALITIFFFYLVQKKTLVRGCYKRYRLQRSEEKDIYKRRKKKGLLSKIQYVTYTILRFKNKIWRKVATIPIFPLAKGEIVPSCEKVSVRKGKNEYKSLHSIHQGRLLFLIFDPGNFCVHSISFLLSLQLQTISFFFFFFQGVKELKIFIALPSLNYILSFSTFHFFLKDHFCEKFRI